MQTAKKFTAATKLFIRNVLARVKAVLEEIGEACRWFVKKDFSTWYLSCAALDKGSDNASLAFVGRREIANDFAQILYDGEGSLTSQGASWRWRAAAELARAGPADIACREVFSLRRKPPQDAFLHQTLVDSKVALTRGFEYWYRHQVSGNFRRTYQHSVAAGMQLRWVTDARELAPFYAEMLMPSAAILHTKWAYTPPLEFFRSRWRPGCLAIVEDAAGRALGGCFVLKPKISSWRLFRVGIIPEALSDTKLRGMVTTQLYFRFFEAACQTGQTSVSIGLALASAAGGAWRNKVLWGAAPGPRLATYPTCAVWARTPLGKKELDRHQLFSLIGDQLIQP